MSISLQNKIRSLEQRIEQLESNLRVAMEAIQDLEAWRIECIGEESAKAQNVKLTIASRKHA